MLTVILDSESVDQNYDKIVNVLNELKKFKVRIRRTDTTISNATLNKIRSIGKINLNEHIEKFLQEIYNELSFVPKNEQQKQFLYAIHKYAIHKNNQHYIHNGIFVTEGEILEKLVKNGKALYGLRDFYPNLILVNSVSALDSIKYYNNIYEFFNKSKEPYLRQEIYTNLIKSKFPHILTLKENFDSNNSSSEPIDNLALKFRKILYSLDNIGFEHYFGNLKKKYIQSTQIMPAVENLKNGILQPEHLQGFYDPDNSFILFYHTEYLISLITGIFDNLALLSKEQYGIEIIPIRISLNKDSGKDFLKKLKEKNLQLKEFIDCYRNFINLFYEFRNDIIHTRGLKIIASQICPNWSNFVNISNKVLNYLNQLGNIESEYKFISQWGYVRKNNKDLVDPYFFSKESISRLINFINGYTEITVKSLE